MSFIAGTCTGMYDGPWPLSLVWEALKHEEEDACHYVRQQHCRSQARELRDRADLPLLLQFSTIKAFMRNNCVVYMVVWMVPIESGFIVKTCCSMLSHISLFSFLFNRFTSRGGRVAIIITAAAARWDLDFRWEIMSTANLSAESITPSIITSKREKRTKRAVGVTQLHTEWLQCLKTSQKKSQCQTNNFDIPCPNKSLSHSFTHISDGFGHAFS